MDVLRRAYPPEQVVAGAIRVESARVAPDRVVQRSPFLVLSLVAEGATAPRVRALAAEVGMTGITVSVGDDEKTLLWGKLVQLAPLALVTSAAGGTMQVARADPQVSRLLEPCIDEAAGVGRAEGADVDAGAMKGIIRGLGGDFGTSMQRDVAAGRPLELDAIAGPIIRGGRRHGIPTPATDELVELVKARAAKPA
jgi:2-dehydropantoate 2-reductase